MSNTTSKHELQSFRQRMSKVGVQPSISLADPMGISLLGHANFDASEGEFEASPHLMLTLCTSQIGRMGRFSNGLNIEGVIRPGTFAMALPNTPAQGYWSKTQMLGIAINLEKLSDYSDNNYSIDDLLPAASCLHNDPLLSSVMLAMLRDAELHGMSSAFFEQGLCLLLKHLTAFQKKVLVEKDVYPLNSVKLHRVLDLMESRLEDDVRVAELAALTAQDTRSFTRAFSAATGFSPYAYFTIRRMEHAKQLMLNTPLTITDIGLRVGYANPSKFSAAFRRICGVSPSLWRREQ